jgi:hypothetical protein
MIRHRSGSAFPFRGLKTSSANVTALADLYYPISTQFLLKTKPTMYVEIVEKWIKLFDFSHEKQLNLNKNSNTYSSGIRRSIFSYLLNFLPCFAFI